MKFFANMPLALKIGLLVGLVGLIVVVSVLLREHLLLVLVILAIGGVVAVGALLVYAMIKKRREKRQGDAFGEGLKQIARNNPQAVAADKARKARLDENPDLTLTRLYNALEAHRARPGRDRRRRRRERGRRQHRDPDTGGEQGQHASEHTRRHGGRF